MSATSGVIDIVAAWVDFLGRESLCIVIVFAAVAAVARVTRRCGPALQLTLWSLVFVRMVLPPGLTHPLSVGVLLGRLTETSLQVTGGDPDRVEEFSETANSGSIRAVETDTIRSYPWQSGLAVAWLFGAIVTHGFFRRRRGEFLRVANAAKPVLNPQMLTMAETWRRKLQVRREVRLVSSKESFAPFTHGVFRPVIFIPRAVVEDSGSLEPVLAHEMAHVARFDALWLGLQHILHAIYFFHPLVWIGGAKLNLERERLCDATVVSAGRLAARDYVEGLLNVLRLDLQGVEAPTMTARKRRIGVRIQNIIERDGRNRPHVGLAVAVTVALGVFLLPLAGDRADALPAPDSLPDQGASEARSTATDLQLVNPLPEGRVTRSWGPGYLDPFTMKKVFHQGIDLGAAMGTEVLAAAGGVVTVATDAYEEIPGSGTVVIVDHGNGYHTYYGHLQTIEVSPGQMVEQNDVIATVGSTGKSTGPHLHFEVQHNGATEDPATFVNEWR